MRETFLLSNIVPQDTTVNTGPWNALERYCRSLTAQYEDVWVVSGTLRLPKRAPKGGRVGHGEGDAQGIPERGRGGQEEGDPGGERLFVSYEVQSPPKLSVFYIFTFK